MRTVNSLIGSAIERLEDLRFLRGRGQYVDDALEVAHSGSQETLRLAAGADDAQTGGELPDAPAAVPRLERDVVREQDEEDGDEVRREHEPIGPERAEHDREREDRAELNDDVEERRRES